MRLAWVVAALLVSTACAQPRGALLVQVVSLDYQGADVDLIEVVGVRLETGGDPLPPATVAVNASTSLARPIRVLSAADLPAGTYVGTIRFVRAHTIIVSRPFRVSVTGTTVFTALLSRLCEGVMCPGGGDERSIACLAGRCVPPECSEENPELCPMPECEDAESCPPSAVDCARGACTASGVCVLEPVDAVCAPADRCDGVLGCVPIATGPLEPPELLTPLPGSYTRSLRGTTLHLLNFAWTPVVGAQSYATSFAYDCPGGLPDCEPTSSFGQILLPSVTTLGHNFETTLEHEGSPSGYRLYFRIRACTDHDATVGCVETPWSYAEIGRVRGDYDGDGYADLAIGGQGGVWIHHGSAAGLESAARTFIPSAFEIFEMTSADLDGDGYGDLVVGTPEADATSVGVFFGGPDGLTVTPFPNLAASQAVTGADCCYPSALGDLDLDGRADVALVARGFDADPRTDLGALFLFAGSADRTLREVGWLMYGTEPGLPRDAVVVDYGGSSAIVRSDPIARFPLRVGAPGDGGRIWGHPIVDGTLAIGASMEVDAGLALLEGGDLGAALAASDLDGDGTVELIASAPLAAPAGALIVFDGPSASSWPRAFADGTDTSARFGETIVPCDLDGDRDDELLVAAPGGPGAAGALFFYDFEGGVLEPRVGMASLGIVGGVECTSGLSCADVNGDGLDEVIVGCPGEGARGAVHVIDRDGVAVQTLAGPGASARFGVRVAR